MFDEMVTYLIIAFILGAVISIAFRFGFSYLNKKQSEVFIAEMDEKMIRLNKEIQKRTGNLQESIDMISKEHVDMMKYLAERDQPKGPSHEEKNDSSESQPKET